MRKTVIWILLIAMLSGVCAGAQAASAPAADGSLDAVLAKGELILGLDDSFPPMGFRDDNNDIVGYDIDLAGAVCVKLGVKLVAQPIDWAAKDLELNSGNIDCIWNGMSDTPDREDSMACSIDYLNNKIVLLVNNKDYKSKEDLVGKTIGVQSGSTAEDVINSDQYKDFKASLKDVLSYDDYLTAIMDLQNGNTDAVLIDQVVANYRMNTLQDPSLFTIDNLADDMYCVGFRKTDVALRDAVNQALIELAKDGSVARISEKWFGADISTIQ